MSMTLSVSRSLLPPGEREQASDDYLQSTDEHSPTREAGGMAPVGTGAVSCVRGRVLRTVGTPNP